VKLALKIVAWILCVFVLLSIGLRRADTIADEDIHFAQGYAIGSVLFSLAAAFGLWFLVQHVIRKRKGFPPWIGVLAIGISAALLVLDVGRQSVAEASCAKPPEAYGEPPAGWKYVKADPARRAEILKAFEMTDDPGHDISIAKAGAAEVLVLGFPEESSSFVAGARSGARKAGAKVTEAPYGDAIVLDYPNDAARGVVGVANCSTMYLVGMDEEHVDTIGRAIFG
jgi:hypothetical protein